MFNGYLSFGGREIINVARTQAYIDNLEAPIPLDSCIEPGGLVAVLGDGEYNSPLVDDAPWFDPNIPASGRFYGFYPLDIQGIEDSTAGATVQESVANGGTVGQERYSTRPIRISGILLGADDEAIAVGQAWLDAALRPGQCDQHGTGTCGGAQVCYFVGTPSDEPCYETEYIPVDVQELARETPETSPVILRNPIYGGIWKMRVDIEDALAEGLILRYGAVSQADASTLVEAAGPVIVRRTNVIRNPRFANGFMSWAAVDGDTDLLGEPGEEYLLRTGGEPGEDFYYRWSATPNASTSEKRSIADDSIVSVNLAPSPRGTVAWQRNNLSETLTANAVAPAGQPDGIETANKIEYTSATSANAGVRFIALPEGDHVISAWMYHEVVHAATTIGWTLVGTGLELAGLPTAQGVWERVSWALTVPPGGGTVAFKLSASGSSTSGVYYLTGLLVETGDVLNDYYDGSTAGSSVTTISGEVDGFNGQSILTFDALHELEGSTLTARVRAAEDDAILAEGSYALDTAWTRFSLLTPTASGVYVEFETAGVVGLTRVDLEAGFTPLPYLDGDQPASSALAGYLTGTLEPEYLIEYLGDPGNSASRATWLGEPRIGVPQDADFATFAEGVCDVYPWFDVLQGTFSGTPEVEVRLPIPIAESNRHLERTLHDVKRVAGPTKIGDMITHGGGIIRHVDMTIVAGKPGRYGASTDLMVDQVMSELPTTAWLDGAFDCSEPDSVSIIDPDCPPVPAPPRPPSLPNACVTNESVWQRYWLTIPETVVNNWSTTSTMVTIRSGAQAVRQVRVRAYPNPFKRDPGTTMGRRENRADNAALRLDGANWANLSGVGTATGRRVGFTEHCGVNHYRATASAAHAADAFGIVSGGAGMNLLAAGELWRPSIDVRSSVGRNVKLRYIYLNAADAVVGASNNYGPVTAVTANTWTRLKTSGTAPLTAPAGTVRVHVGVVGDGAAWAAGQTLDATAPNIEVSNVWGDFAIDTWWDAFRLADDCTELPADGFYYGWSGEVGVGASVAMQSPIDPCSYCSEFVVSYLPANTELTVDAILERSYASVAGAPAAGANHLLYSGDGTPMTWPELTCGTEYLLAIDVPEPLLDDVYVTVSVATRE